MRIHDFMKYINLFFLYYHILYIKILDYIFQFENEGFNLLKELLYFTLYPSRLGTIESETYQLEKG